MNEHEYHSYDSHECRSENFEECEHNDRPLADNSGYLFSIKYPKELSELITGNKHHRVTITFYDYNEGSMVDPIWFTYAHMDGGYASHHWGKLKGRFSDLELKAVAHETMAEDYRSVSEDYNKEDGRA